MKPLPFVWPYVLVFWPVYVWAFLPEMKIVKAGTKGAKHAGSKDSGSMKVLLGATGAALFVSYPLAFVDAWSFPGSLHLPLFVAGLLLIVLGSLLRRYCWRTLGEYFTGDVRVREGQPVIRSGPYRLVRHPSYTAAMMMFIGIGLSLGSWLSFALITIVAVASYCYRVVIEERALLNTIGEPYGAYMRECKRFIPYLV